MYHWIDKGAKWEILVGRLTKLNVNENLSELTGLVLLSSSQGRPTHYSEFYGFSITIPRCYKNVYVKTVFSTTTDSGTLFFQNVFLWLIRIGIFFICVICLIGFPIKSLSLPSSLLLVHCLGLAVLLFRNKSWIRKN